ncbi:MAG: hypothetical protein ACOYYJ_13970 [Chloroflexota bacterium]
MTVHKKALCMEDVFSSAAQLPMLERLSLARKLLDTVVHNLAAEDAEDVNWQTMGLDAFQKEWDNEEDAVYDDWRKQYGVSTG